jgi:hypothetical protein
MWSQILQQNSRTTIVNLYHTEIVDNNDDREEKILHTLTTNIVN